MSSAALIDALSTEEARETLVRCCGANAWVNGMLARRPFGDDAGLFRAAEEIWAAMDTAAILEALDHHPRIGADLEQLRKRFASTAAWAAGEQAGASAATEETLRALRDGNVRYEARFGHIFVVCATGKSAEEMVALLEKRLPNDHATELRIAAAEQAKITRLRLEKLQ